MTRPPVQSTISNGFAMMQAAARPLGQIGKGDHYENAVTSVDRGGFVAVVERVRSL